MEGEEFVLAPIRHSRQNSQPPALSQKLYSHSFGAEHSRTNSDDGQKLIIPAFRSASTPVFDPELVNHVPLENDKPHHITVRSASSSRLADSPLRYLDVGTQWPALVAHVTQGLATSTRLAEFFQNASADESSETGSTLGQLDAMQHTLQSVESILVEERLERARQRQTKLMVVEQVGKPLFRFCKEAKERLELLVIEKEQLNQTLEATTALLQHHKLECLSVWDEMKSSENSGSSSSSNNSSVFQPSHRRTSSFSSRVTTSMLLSVSATGNKKKNVEFGFKAFKQYEILMRKTHLMHFRFIKDTNRMLNSLEELERSRLHALNVHCQLYSQLKQRSVTIRSPDTQIQEFLISKFDVSERRPLRFVSLPYDLPCTAEDLREGRLISSSETLSSLSSTIANCVNTPEICSNVSIDDFTMNHSFSAPFNLAAFLGYPNASEYSSQRRKSDDRPPPPPFDDREIGSLKRSRIGRLLLNIDTDTDLPKLRPEETDHEGSGNLELMVAPSSWKLLYCSVRPGKFLLCSKRDVGKAVRFPLRAARFSRFGRGEIPTRSFCFCVTFPHSSQRLMFACKTEVAVQDWLQALTRAAVTERGVVGRSLASPALALVGEKQSLSERLDAIERGVASIREAISSRENLAEWLEAESDEEDEDGPVNTVQVVDSKQSELSSAVKESYLKAELHGYLDRMLIGMVAHEPYWGMGAHTHWDLMSVVSRKYWVVLKIFSSNPGALVNLLRSVIHKHKSIDRLAKVILNIAMCCGTAVEILNALIEEEVSKTPFETQLFRTDSLSSKMWGFFAIAEGKTYLPKMLAKPVQACVLDASASDAPAIDFELDPAKISHVKSLHEHFKTREQDSGSNSNSSNSNSVVISSSNIGSSSNGTGSGNSTPKAASIHHHHHSLSSGNSLALYGGSNNNSSGGGGGGSTTPSGGAKTISWWAKKLHSTSDDKTSGSGEELAVLSSPGFRRVSVNTLSTTTTTTSSTSLITSSSASLNNGNNNNNTNPPSPSPSLFRRISVSKRTSNADDKEESIAFLNTNSPFVIDEHPSRRLSASEIPLIVSTRYSTLEQAYFLKARQNDLIVEKKSPVGMPRSESTMALPVKQDKPKALTPAVSREDPTEFVRQAKVAQNLSHLEQCCMYFISEIERSLDYCPRSLRVIAHSVRRSVGQTFPSARVAAVGSFFFLRFLCPQMLQVAWAPEVSSNMTTTARRNLLLLTKVLQFLANCASDETMTREQVQAALAAKEASMMPLANFVWAQRPRVSQFLNNLAQPPDARFLKNLVEPSAQALEEQARDLDLDLEWFVTHVLASAVNSDADLDENKSNKLLGVAN